MQLKFITNACEIFIADGKKLLCDPWLSEGAFEGSWYHWPPLRTTPPDVSDYDYLYISHIDPDHFDPKTLECFDHTKPVIILKFENDFLKTNLALLGFCNIHEISEGVKTTFGPFELTLSGPFQKTRLGDAAAIGNVIDSAILVEADGFKVLNTVDNLPSVESAEKLQMKYGPFDLVQLNYNSAGPYPDCFVQYSEEKRKFLADEFLVKQLNHFCELACTFVGARVMPFAGDYVLVGREWKKNFFNATCSPEYAAAFMEDWFQQHSLLYLRPVVMKEGAIFDLKRPEFLPIPYCRSDVSRFIYAEQRSHIQYPYEEGGHFTPTKDELALACEQAYEKLTHYRHKFKLMTDTTIHLVAGDFQCAFSLDVKFICFGKPPIAKPYLQCFLDRRLLWRLLTRKANWNNAEIGAHISFDREPDIYEQDVHLLLNFFHL